VRALAYSALALFLGALVMSGNPRNLGWRKASAAKRLEERTASTDRYVDMGLCIAVVVKDETGEEIVPGAPKLRIIRQHIRGGMVDTFRGRPKFCGPSRNPHTIYVSEDAERLILHDDPSLTDRLLVYGSEGAGKTNALVAWVALRVLSFTGQNREIGVSAPTSKRAEVVWQTFLDRLPHAWFRWVERDSVFYFRNAVRVRLLSAHQASAAEGSPYQGYTFSAAAVDEIQDQIERYPDLEMRVRYGPDGRSPIFCSATAKDSSDFRDWRDRCLATGLWQKHVLYGRRSPFIHDRVWDEREKTLTDRERRRRIGAEDVPPEKQVYYSWDRAQNLRPIPIIGATDVTQRELSPWGANYTLLLAHDPGATIDTTIALRAYRFHGETLPRWFAVDEFVSNNRNLEGHIKDVLAACRQRYGCNQLDWRGRPSTDTAHALVFADPYGDRENDDKHPDRTVYTVWRQHGFTILRPTPQGKNVPKQARIEMINTLLCSTSGRRLFVATKDDGSPVAPQLVRSFEESERNAADIAERDNKGSAKDVSHAAAATGYGLWAIEHPRMIRIGART
jgi:hypothetical protein